MQIAAAGGQLISISNPSDFITAVSSATKATTTQKAETEVGARLTAALLLVDNFSEEQQLEASQQPQQWSESDYTLFDPYIELAFGSFSRSRSESTSYPNNIREEFSGGVTSSGIVPIGFCDNRYANGADAGFVSYMINRTADFTPLAWNAYAGWNTNGNTIGTVVANSILLALFRDSAGAQNARFNSLRILEDLHYQADIRQQLAGYTDQISNMNETSSNLAPDLTFYEQYAYKLLSARYDDQVAAPYHLDAVMSLESIYYPWNRTFEIGLHLSSS